MLGGLVVGLCALVLSSNVLWFVMFWVMHIIGD
jgi:hypothetical protein